MGGGGYGLSGDLRSYVANPYLIDTYSYTVNPAYAERFRDAVFVNVGVPGAQVTQPFTNFGGQSFGAIFSISPRVTVGGMLALESNAGITALNTDVASALASFGLITFGGWTGGIFPPGAVQGIPLRGRNTAYLSTSYNTGGVVLGAGVSYVSSILSPIVTAPIQQPQGQPTANLTQIGFNAGVLVTTSTASALDIGATLLLPRVTFPISGSTTGTRALSATVLGLNARYIARLSKNFWLIPMANFYSISADPVVGNSTAFDAGIGMNYQVNNLLFVGGVGVSATSGGNLGPLPISSELVLPRFNLGVEYLATNWLRLRAGYNHTTANRTIGATSATPEARYTIYNNYGLVNGGVTLGFGLLFGGFTLDLTTDTEAIRRGLGGFGTTSSFGYVSAVFRF
jgi:hypothetical protein